MSYSYPSFNDMMGAVANINDVYGVRRREDEAKRQAYLNMQLEKLYSSPDYNEGAKVGIIDELLDGFGYKTKDTRQVENLNKIRQKEAELFGSAYDSNDLESNESWLARRIGGDYYAPGYSVDSPQRLAEGDKKTGLGDVGNAAMGLLSILDNRSVPTAVYNATDSNPETTILGGLADGVKDQLSFITGNNEADGSAKGWADVMRDNGNLDGWTVDALGFAGDIATNPLSWLGAPAAMKGVEVGGKVASGVGNAAKSVGSAAKTAGKAAKNASKATAKATAKGASKVASKVGKYATKDNAKEAFVKSASKVSDVFEKAKNANVASAVGKKIKPDKIDDIFNAVKKANQGNDEVIQAILNEQKRFKVAKEINDWDTMSEVFRNINDVMNKSSK